MENLKSYEWELRYCSSGLNRHGQPTDILHDFYLPALQRITSYDRVAGYFRSSSLAAASQGYTAFLNHDGTMRLIVGADLQLQDVAAILAGNHQRLSDSLMKELENEDNWPEDVKNGVALLAAMVASGKLDVKVAFRVNGHTGAPLSVDSVEDGYVHEKWFVMKDAEGNRIYGAGSPNESRTALIHNAENIDINCDWEGERDAKRTDMAEADFNALWNGLNPHMVVLDIPDAVKNKLIRMKNLRNRPTEIDGTVLPAPVELTPEEMLKFAVLKDAPKMPNGIYIGMYSAPVEAWPHQEVVSRRLIENYPFSYMMCDEVGLGKTIEAALAIRSLVLSERVERVTVVAPASLTDQWQRELAQKALLPFAKTQVKPGGLGKVQHSFIYPQKRALTDTDLYSPALNIVSSGLVSRKERTTAIDQAEKCDVILVDEAHYARRQNPREGSSGTPKYGYLYRAIEGHLKKKAESLWLATATPMQIDRIEVYDLFCLADRSGEFLSDPTLSMTYFQLLGKLAYAQDLKRQQWMLLGQSYQQLEALDPFLWEYIQKTAVNSKNRKALKDLPIKDPLKADIRYLKQPMFAASPLSRVMMRHTRQLLEIYRRNGELTSNLAVRHVRPICAIAFTAAEAAFYSSLEGYCNGLNAQMHKYNPEVRQVMGFYLNFLQLRFASSLYAIRQTLSRRLKRVNNTLLLGGRTFATEEDFEEAIDELRDTEEYDENDLSELAFDALLKDRSVPDLKWEKECLEKMLLELGKMHETPSKIQRLLDELTTRMHHGRIRQTVLFTRFYDTLTSIRKELKIRDSNLRVGVYSGSHAIWYNPAVSQDINTDHEEIKRLFIAGEIDLLLCTDAAAEGLNLQTADLLINFDMGWNPMKIEQRIGRIDRIGQKYADIEVMNMCYLDSTEEIVYGRLCERLLQAGLVVGAQQISMLPVDANQFRRLHDGDLTLDELEKESKKRLKEQKEATASMEMSADELYSMYKRVSSEMKQMQYPATLDSMWDAFTTSPYLKSLGAEIRPDGMFCFPTSNLLPGFTGTINRDLAGSAEEFMTWGNSAVDAALDKLCSPIEDCDYAKRISVRKENIELAAWLVSSMAGTRLIRAYADLSDLRVNQSRPLTDDDIREAEAILKQDLDVEIIRTNIARRAVKKNVEIAKLHEDFVSCCAVAVLEKQIQQGNLKYSDALKDLTECIKVVGVDLPRRFSGKATLLLFPISEHAGEVRTVVSGELLQSCIEMIQRSASGIKKKKSQIMTSEVTRRLQPKRLGNNVSN